MRGFLWQKLGVSWANQEELVTLAVFWLHPPSFIETCPSAVPELTPYTSHAGSFPGSHHFSFLPPPLPAQVSHSSSLASLSDKTQFPSFLRTLASDLTSSRLVAQLVVHFGWSWVGILAQDDDYGQQSSSLVIQELGQAGICIEFHLHVPSQPSLEKTEALVREMGRCTATGIIVFVSNLSFQIILQGLLGQGISGRVWVSRETLHAALALSIPGVSQVLQGSFSLLQRTSQVLGFPEFFARLHPARTPEDMFIERFWEVTFRCTWPRGSRGPVGNSSVAGGIRFCSGNESLIGWEYPFQDVVKLDVGYPAVYSIAHALQDLGTCEQGDGTCADPWHFQPWQLLHPLRKVHFKTVDGTEIVFDANGDMVTTFDLLQGQKTPEGLFRFVRIGILNPQASSGQSMMVQMMKEDFQVPSSACSKSCAPGSSQIMRQGAPHCCFDCSPCPEGHFADQRDMARCLPCPGEQAPSPARDGCRPLPEIFLSWREPLGQALAAGAVALAAAALGTLTLFLRRRRARAVRAAHGALSRALLGALALCSLSALLFLGPPRAATCLLRRAAFAVVFAVAVSCVLAKTLAVVLAFRVTRPDDPLRVCLGPRASAAVVLGASSLQVLLCGLWLSISPPVPQRDTASEPGHVVVRCQEGSGAAFYCMLGYLGLLAAVTLSVAFLARRLPAAFNETKLLTLSMLLFCSVWTAFLPLYHSARGKATVAVEVFSILASTAGLLGCIFLPKCYIILRRREQNVPARLWRGCGPSGEGRARSSRAAVSPGPCHKPS
ncbi:extracellular calcium-sensing receptor-like [Equus przewalskii]|uniref:Extracellular calcium-sensing receptor-like n=1 Tax=Equus przewalskii TaxID=9798 RepID=A0ABM4JG55_EQUPR